MSRREKFFDRDYRAAYADSFVDTSIATQIRVLREQRGWTQGRLAEETGMKQSRICALEDANYSSWSTKTLKRLARAFDVPLRVSFGTFGELVRDVRGFNRLALQRNGFTEDPAFASRGVAAGWGSNIAFEHPQDTAGCVEVAAADETARRTARVIPFEPRAHVALAHDETRPLTATG